MLYLQNQAERIEEQTHFIRTHKHHIRTYFKINKRGSIGKERESKGKKAKKIKKIRE